MNNDTTRLTGRGLTIIITIWFSFIVLVVGVIVVLYNPILLFLALVSATLTNVVIFHLDQEIKEPITRMNVLHNMFCLPRLKEKKQ